MSYLVVGTRAGDRWRIEVRDVGTAEAESLYTVEPAARALLREHGIDDAESVDLQLLLPDFEVDLDRHGMPHDTTWDTSVLSGVILLVVAVSVLGFVLLRLL